MQLFFDFLQNFFGDLKLGSSNGIFTFGFCHAVTFLAVVSCIFGNVDQITEKRKTRRCSAKPGRAGLVYDAATGEALSSSICCLSPSQHYDKEGDYKNCEGYAGQDFFDPSLWLFVVYINVAPQVD